MWRILGAFLRSNLNLKSLMLKSQPWLICEKIFDLKSALFEVRYIRRMFLGGKSQ